MFEQLKEMICNYVEIEPEKITPNSRFIEDLGFNSYDFMCMVGEVEDTFDIEIEERGATTIKTVKDAIDYIESQMKN